MIKHIVLLNWKDDVSEQQIDSVTSGFRRLKEEIPEIVGYSFGRDAGFYRGNADYVLIAEFKTEAGFKKVRCTPATSRLLEEYCRAYLVVFSISPI